MPWGWTVGAKGYYDVKNGRSPEYDVVGLYQNPCKCWSLGVYYLQFPDRAQYNFMLSLTGIGWTESFGTAVVRSILGPLLIGRKVCRGLCREDRMGGRNRTYLSQGWTGVDGNQMVWKECSWETPCWAASPGVISVRLR